MGKEISFGLFWWLPSVGHDRNVCQNVYGGFQLVKFFTRVEATGVLSQDVRQFGG